MESLVLRSHMLWNHEPIKGALTPSPSPIRWERVAGRPGEGSRVMKASFRFFACFGTMNLIEGALASASSRSVTA